MAERMIAFEDTSYVPPCLEDNLIRVDFRPTMQRIGDKGAKGWNAELEAYVIESEPLGDTTEEENGDISVKFLQYHSNSARDEKGVDHYKGWTGPETIRILIVTWRAETNTIDLEYLHPRNFRYHLPGHESRKHTQNAILASVALRQELWPEQE